MRESTILHSRVDSIWCSVVPCWVPYWVFCSQTAAFMASLQCYIFFMGLPLRCFQQLSALRLATQRLPWTLTSTAEVCPFRSSRTSERSSYCPNTSLDMDWTVSRHTEPSLRTALMGRKFLSVILWLLAQNYCIRRYYALSLRSCVKRTVQC